MRISVAVEPPSIAPISRFVHSFASLKQAFSYFPSVVVARPPAYLATVRESGRPRVHPVTPIVAVDALYVFMEPTSPKGRDLRERRWYALHNGVPDTAGSGGELFIAGTGFAVEDARRRSAAAEAAGYEPAERYVLFELTIEEARCNAYGDVALPATRRWTAGG